MTQKFTIDAQIEEVTMALDDYKYLQTPKQFDFRVSRLRQVLATLRWVKEHGDVIKALHRLKELQREDPEIFTRALEKSGAKA